MKSLLFSTITFFYCFFMLPAQGNQEKSFYSKAKTVIIELASLNQLKLKNSNKEHEFKITFNNHADFTTPEFYEDKKVVYVKVKGIIELNALEKNKYRAGQPLYPNYEITVPKNVQLKIVYDKGNFMTSNLVGDLSLYLNHGIVDVTGFKGNVSIQSYSGVINCYLENSLVNVESNKGKLIDKLIDERLVKTAKSIKGVYGERINNLFIKTVKAKVKMYPIKSQ